MLCQRPLSMKAKFKDILPVIERKGCPWSRLEVCRVTVSLVASPVCRPMPSIPPRGVPSVEPPTREPRVPVSPCPRDPVSVCTQDTLTHHAQCGEQDEWRKSWILLTQLLAIPIEIPVVGCQLSMHFCICIQKFFQRLILKSLPKYWAIFKMKLLISLHLQFVLVQRKYDQGGCWPHETAAHVL